MEPQVYISNPPEGCNGTLAEMLIEWENARRYEASLRLGPLALEDVRS